MQAETIRWCGGCRVFRRTRSLVFQGRDGAETIRRPSDPRPQLLRSQQDVLPLVQTVSEQRQTHARFHRNVSRCLGSSGGRRGGDGGGGGGGRPLNSASVPFVQLVGGEGLVPALHEAGLGRHLLRDAGRQGVQHQDGLQGHGDQTRRPHRQPVQVCPALSVPQVVVDWTIWTSSVAQRVCVCAAGPWC